MRCYIETLQIQVIKEKPEMFWDLRMLTVTSGEPLYPLTLDRSSTVCTAVGRDIVPIVIILKTSCGSNP